MLIWNINIFNSINSKEKIENMRRIIIKTLSN